MLLLFARATRDRDRQPSTPVQDELIAHHEAVAAAAVAGEKRAARKEELDKAHARIAELKQQVSDVRASRLSPVRT